MLRSQLKKGALPGSSRAILWHFRAWPVRGPAGHPAATGLFFGPAGTREESELNSTRAPLTKRRRDLIVRTPTVQDIVREAAGYLPGACRRTTNKGDKMPLKETFNCDHNNRCPPGSRARREPAGATSPTGTGAIGTEA
ncbi:hypothetical protein Bbelb_158740 [Branchiostoma belcheri]|nr:hypothetical protein Bbelb_158740 [Branchiostoma belcheri]